MVALCPRRCRKHHVTPVPPPRPRGSGTAVQGLPCGLVLLYSEESRPSLSGHGSHVCGSQVMSASVSPVGWGRRCPCTCAEPFLGPLLEAGDQTPHPHPYTAPWAGSSSGAGHSGCWRCVRSTRAPPSQREQHPARHDSQNHLQTSPCGPRAARTEIPALMLQRVSKRTGCEECAPASGAPRVRCRTLTSATVLIAGSWDQLPHPIGLCTERGACLGFSLYLSSAPPGSGLG